MEKRQQRISDIMLNNYHETPTTSQNSPPESPPVRSLSVSSLSSCRSSLSDEEDGSLDHQTYHPPHEFVTQTNRSVRNDPVSVNKAVPAAIGDRFFVEQGGGGGGGIPGRRGGGVNTTSGTREMMQPSSTMTTRRTGSEGAMKKAALGFRVFGFVFCLTSFSVMAADRSKGWAVDSFYRYIEFRYCVTVNVIGFVYSALQGLNLACQLSFGKLVSGSHLRYIFDFAFDQILAYLLISSSSSAAIRVDDWQSNWGKDKFPDMAGASVAVSFMAFVSLASSSLISGYTLCTL